MTNVVVNFKTDKRLREEAKKVAKEIGLPLGTIMNHYLRELVAEKQVTFASHPVPNKKTVERWSVIEQDITNNKNMSPAFTDSREAIEWLQK